MRAGGSNSSNSDSSSRQRRGGAARRVVGGRVWPAPRAEHGAAFAAGACGCTAASGGRIGHSRRARGLGRPLVLCAHQTGRGEAAAASATHAPDGGGGCRGCPIDAIDAIDAAGWGRSPAVVVVVVFFVLRGAVGVPVGVPRGRRCRGRLQQ